MSVIDCPEMAAQYPAEETKVGGDITAGKSVGKDETQKYFLLSGFFLGQANMSESLSLTRSTSTSDTVHIHL